MDIVRLKSGEDRVKIVVKKTNQYFQDLIKKAEIEAKVLVENSDKSIYHLEVPMNNVISLEKEKKKKEIRKKTEKFQNLMSTIGLLDKETKKLNNRRKDK